MKKIIVFLIAIFGFLSIMVAAPSVRAANVLAPACEGAAANSAVCQESQNNTQNPLVGPEGIITRVTQIVVFVVGIAAVLMIMISGLRYITSAGDPAGVNGAKNGILYSTIGLAVAVLGQAIVTIVLSKL